MKLRKIEKVGKYRTGTLNTTYGNIVKKTFKPNVTDMNDPVKAQASWGIIDDKGREAFIWSYKYNGDIEDCDTFSVGGDEDLLHDIFGDDDNGLVLSRLYKKKRDRMNESAKKIKFNKAYIKIVEKIQNHCFELSDIRQDVFANGDPLWRESEEGQLYADETNLLIDASGYLYDAKILMTNFE